MKHNFKKILCVLLACLMVIPFCTEFAKLPQIWAASSDIVDIPRCQYESRFKQRFKR